MNENPEIDGLQRSKHMGAMKNHRITLTRQIATLGWRGWPVLILTTLLMELRARKAKNEQNEPLFSATEWSISLSRADSLIDSVRFAMRQISLSVFISCLCVSRCVRARVCVCEGSAMGRKRDRTRSAACVAIFLFLFYSCIWQRCTWQTAQQRRMSFWHFEILYVSMCVEMNARIRMVKPTKMYFWSIFRGRGDSNWRVLRS